jgi:hypothetical protein
MSACASETVSERVSEDVVEQLDQFSVLFPCYPSLVYYVHRVSEWVGGWVGGWVSE